MSDKIKVGVDPNLCSVLVIEIGDPLDADGRVILLNREEALSLLEQLPSEIAKMPVKI